jgi:hypothetical protein
MKLEKFFWSTLFCRVKGEENFNESSKMIEKNVILLYNINCGNVASRTPPQVGRYEDNPDQQ